MNPQKTDFKSGASTNFAIETAKKLNFKEAWLHTGPRGTGVEPVTIILKTNVLPIKLTPPLLARFMSIKAGGIIGETLEEATYKTQIPQRVRRDSNPRCLRTSVFKTDALNRSATHPTVLDKPPYIFIYKKDF